MNIENNDLRIEQKPLTGVNRIDQLRQKKRGDARISIEDIKSKIQLENMVSQQYLLID